MTFENQKVICSYREFAVGALCCIGAFIGVYIYGYRTCETKYHDEVRSIENELKDIKRKQSKKSEE